MTIVWWFFPVFFLLVGARFFLRSYFKSRGEPKWIGNTFMYPNPVGLGSLILGIVFVLIGLAFVAGHYLQ